MLWDGRFAAPDNGRSIGAVFRLFALSSFVYLGLTALIGFLFLFDSFHNFFDETQLVTLHWNLGFQGWLAQIVAGSVLFLASLLAGKPVDTRLARLQFRLMNGGLIAMGLGLLLTALTEANLGHALIGPPLGRQVLTGLSQWGVTSYVWLLQLGYLAFAAAFTVMFVNLRRTLHADAAVEQRTGLPGLYYEAYSIFAILGPIGWLAWTIVPIRNWLVSWPLLGSGNGYQAIHHALFIHIPVWGMAAFAIGVAYQSVPALTGRDTVQLTRRREAMFWATIVGIMGTIWHPKVTQGPPVYMAAVTILLFVATLDVVEFAGTWFHGVLRRLTDPEYALARNYLVAGVVGVGIAAVFGTVITFDPINSNIFPVGARGTGTLLAAVHAMQGMLTGLTPILLGVAYLIAKWALGARLNNSRQGNWILGIFLAGAYAFNFALYERGQAGWMTMENMAGMNAGTAALWAAVTRIAAGVTILAILAFFNHYARIIRPGIRTTSPSRPPGLQLEREVG